MNLAGLKTAVDRPEFGGQKSLQIAATLNAASISRQVPITALAIQRYLALQDKLYGIETSPEPVAQKAVRYLEVFEQFDLSDPNVNAAFVALLDALDATLTVAFDAADKAAILALGGAPVSEAESLGFSGTTDQELADYIEKVRTW